MSISLLRQLLMKEAVKKSAGSSGIMTINKNIAKDVEKTLQKYIKDALAQGVDLDTLSESQLKYIIELNKPKPLKVYSNEEAIEQLNKFLGKKGEVVDMSGKKLDPGQPIIGGTQDDTVTGIMTKVDDRMKGINETSKKLQELMDERDVMFGKAPKTKKNKKVQEREMFREANEKFNKTDVIADTVTKIWSMEPVEAMKEANKIIGRKGIYKNLTKEQSQKILKDTDDWIFQRDPADRWDYKKNRPFRDDPNFDPDDPSYDPDDGLDYATGGRAGYSLGSLVNQARQEGDGIESRLEQLGGDVTSAEQLLQQINERLESAGSSIPEGGGASIANYTPQPRPSGGYLGGGIGTLGPGKIDNQGIGNQHPGFANLESAMQPFMGRPALHEMPGYKGPQPNMSRPNFNATIDPNFKPVDQLKAAQPEPTTFNSVEDAYAAAQREAQESRKKGFAGQVILPGEQSFEDFSNFYDPSNRFGFSGLKEIPASGGGMQSPSTASSQQNLQKALPGLFAQGGRAGYYTGGITDVKPNLSDIGHGSDALMARTRLMSPGAQTTTSTGLNYLLAEDNDNIRVPFSSGGFNAARRAFLKMMGIGAAGVGAAKTGLFGLLKGSKSAAVKELTQVPINNVEGMPYWFKPLVNKVIKEGEQMKVTEYDRLITHKSQLPNSKTDVYVNQDLNTGDVWVDIGLQKHGFPDGKFGQPVRLEYKASEAIEPDVSKTGKVKSKGGETKDEFWVEEAEFTGGHPENVKFEDVSYEKFGNHGSDFSEVEAFAMGKKKKTRDISSLQKQEEDLADHFSNYPEPDDFASGGRAGFSGGNLVKLLAGKSITGSSRRFLEKVFGKERFETMIANDPDMHRGMLEVVEMFRKKDKEGLKMYMQKFLPHMDDATVEDFIIGGEGTEGIQGQLIRLGSGRDYRDKIQMMKKADNIRKLDQLDVEKMKPNAEGGRIGKWMGGPLGIGKSQLRELLKFMAKGSSHGKTPSEMLKLVNPNQFNKILNDPLLAGKFTPEAPQGIAGLIKDYTKKMHSERADMLGELIGTGRKIKKADDKLITYKMTIIDDMVSKGVDRRTAEEMAEVMSKMVSDQSGFTQKATPKITEQGLLELENIQKNILTKDRKLQATGGLTTMLGE